MYVSMYMYICIYTNICFWSSKCRSERFGVARWCAFPCARALLLLLSISSMCLCVCMCACACLCGCVCARHSLARYCVHAHVLARVHTSYLCTYAHAHPQTDTHAHTHTHTHTYTRAITHMTMLFGPWMVREELHNQIHIYVCVRV